MSDFLGEVMKGWRTASGPSDPPLKFETDGTGQVTFVGYSADEIKEILTTYREHATLMMDLAVRATREQQANLTDAVRYRPEEPISGIDYAGS